MKPAPSAQLGSQTPDLVLAPEAYRHWAQSYDTDPNPVIELEARILKGRLTQLRNKIFLDIACGTGRWMAIAAAEGAHALGADLVIEMLEVAGRKPGLGGRLVRADACRLPFADSCSDIVFCSFALGYVEDMERLIHELSRVVVRGGTVIASDLHPQALKAGWRRTFRLKTTLFEIKSHVYTCSQLVRAGHKAGLKLKALIQPSFGMPELAIMRNAGKGDQIAAASKIPAIIALEWIRP